MHGSTPRPCSFYLEPLGDACGRTEIMLHGCFCGTTCDETAPPCGDCSLGCLVCNI